MQLKTLKNQQYLAKLKPVQRQLLIKAFIEMLKVNPLCSSSHPTEDFVIENLMDRWRTLLNEYKQPGLSWILTQKWADNILNWYDCNKIHFRELAEKCLYYIATFAHCKPEDITILDIDYHYTGPDRFAIIKTKMASGPMSFNIQITKDNIYNFCIRHYWITEEQSVQAEQGNSSLFPGTHNL